MSHYPVENLLREPTEIYTSMTCTALALLAASQPHLFLLTQGMGYNAALSLMALSVVRGYQAFKIKRYHRRLIAMPFYALSTTQVPVSQKWLFLGKGFRWLPHHTQRLHQIKQIKNEAFMQRGKWYQAVRKFCQNHEASYLAKLLGCSSKLNPFRPDPPVGGSPYLHGLGEKDDPVYIPQDVRVGHTFVVGTTRVGKTRLASILINQDIRNGDAVIVVDPKGDLDLVRDMYSACEASGRLNDFRIVHLGFPDLSAHYNPLKNYDQVSEVATRITDAIAAEGEGKQFAAFAWKYVNIVAICLEEMKQPITYKSIAFYISRLDQLLMTYADTIMPAHYQDYHTQIDAILTHHEERQSRKNKNTAPMDRTKAVIEYIKEHINKTITAGNVESLHDQILIDLYDAAIMDKHYYDKITASVGPVLSEINKSNATGIFSFNQSPNEIELMTAIKQKKVIYMGLDSLTNPNIAQAVGKAFLSDLVSTAGKIYKESNANYRLNLHCDELSEIIQDSFVKILNKAGGAGFQVTAYAQTIQDMEVALGSKARAEVTEGNFNTLIMLRVKNEETANLLVKMLPQVGVVDHTQVSMVNDTPHGEDGVYFNTTNEDRVQTSSVPMIDVNDVISLPKGQAFVLASGGELFKVRIPLPVSDKIITMDIKSIIHSLDK
ncbi:conjugative coupling factor TraD, PFGI-1 class [Legionella longbeachae]|uniref:type IV conjugative transfer system coupling protein TraD n=1 Tax=Legionella longbeachae TaxID=450 RepID=UPI0009B769BB|nr:type IV conjugative transfer system coupling protein TraD [Legionella longbeachae]ARB90767.1 conjugative coupling factor TraD, PFGI-1 class [Legionella longbeachae]RZV22660.1 type IV conjugative transfer system coupling protein TraD [Legionella longbeachae]UAK46033.1 type IV conjugative transfer system coupling protein TraD [Legionella longbeachae]VEE03004.1 conjugative coupling factor TraD [Legionella oakridgensis]